MWTFLLRITHTIISQSIVDSSWNTLYILFFVLPVCRAFHDNILFRAIRKLKYKEIKVEKFFLIFVFQVLRLVYIYFLTKLLDLLDTVSKPYFLETLSSCKIWGCHVDDYKGRRLLWCDICSLVDCYPPKYTASYPTKTVT